VQLRKGSQPARNERHVTNSSVIARLQCRRQPETSNCSRSSAKKAIAVIPARGSTYFSRFFVKFVEVSAAGLATAISAYLLAHFGGLPSSSPTPASAPAQTAVQVGPTASEVAGSLRPQPTPPAAAAAVNKQSPAPQQDTDAPVAQPARKAAKDAKALPPRKHTKTDTSGAEKDPPGALPASPADVQPQPVETSPAIDAELQPRSPDVRSSPVAPVDIQRRPVAGAGADPLPPRADPPLEMSAPQPPPTAEQDKGVFSALKRIPDLLRPDPPAPTGETPRPPMPVGTAWPEIREFGN
jgi:hypothetical protein